MFIDAVAVLPDQQKKGIGQALWDRMTAYARDKNYSAIRLLTNPKLKSFNWYKEMDYEESGWVEVFKRI